VGKVYKFKLRKYEMEPVDNQKEINTEQSDSMAQYINSLPTVSLIDSTLQVRADNYWLVISFELIER
jgi:hypothetical protein